MEYTPYRYQTLVENKILINDKVLLEFRRGMGKKSIVLSAVKKLIDKGDVTKVLILVSNFHKKRKWIYETERWEHLNKLNVINIDAKSKKEFINTDESNIYITQRENIVWILEKKDIKFDIIIIDEIDVFSNPRSSRYKKMLDMSDGVKRMIGIMDTKENMECKLWDIMYLFDRGERLGKIRNGFWDRYFFSYIDKNNKIIGRELKEGAKKAIYKELSDIIVNGECIGEEFVPKKINTKTQLELDEIELSKYVYLLNNDASEDDLRQLANGEIEIKGQRFILHNKKIAELRAICDNSDEQVAIIYQYGSDLHNIKANISDIKVIQSMNDIKKWNEGKLRCIAINAEFGGIENEFKLRGERVVWYSLPKTVKVYVNMNKRFQWDDNRCLIIHNLVVKDTIDELFYKKIGEI